jgi:hypothetical protein
VEDVSGARKRAVVSLWMGLSDGVIMCLYDVVCSHMRFYTNLMRVIS